MKTPTQHTPGPWTPCKCNGGEKYNIECKGQGNDLLPIATLRGCDNEANARLAAAAPELLEALGEAFASLNDLFDSGTVAPGYIMERAIAAHGKTSAAIAKATGGKPV